jgi:hypothetical protein
MKTLQMRRSRWWAIAGVAATLALTSPESWAASIELAPTRAICLENPQDPLDVRWVVDFEFGAGADSGSVVKAWLSLPGTIVAEVAVLAVCANPLIPFPEAWPAAAQALELWGAQSFEASEVSVGANVVFTDEVTPESSEIEIPITIEVQAASSASYQPVIMRFWVRLDPVMPNPDVAVAQHIRGSPPRLVLVRME